MIVVIVIVIVMIVVVIVIAMAVAFDDAGQLRAFDGHLETSTDLAGAQQHVGELFVDGCELRGARFRGIARNGFNRIIDELPVYKDLQCELRLAACDGFFRLGIQEVDGHLVSSFVVDQFGAILPVTELDEFTTMWPFGRILMGMVAMVVVGGGCGRRATR